MYPMTDRTRKTHFIGTSSIASRSGQSSVVGTKAAAHYRLRYRSGRARDRALETRRSLGQSAG